MNHIPQNILPQTYEEIIDYLYNVTPAFERDGAGAYKSGLDNSRTLDAYFGHPHRAYRIIHVAGTNGKGSCSHTLAAILQHAGLKVGLYTSPHMTDFTERIRVNGKPMPHEKVIEFVHQHRHFFEPLYPSFFEITTAMALKYFKEEAVDVAVLEVGLGGRLDCTNIVTPELCVITNISLDHTQFLGNTLGAIAGEKAGIIKPGIPVVVGEDLPETRPVFRRKAEEAQAEIIFAQDHPIVTNAVHCTTGGMDYDTTAYGKLHGGLAGDCQMRNTNTILTAVAVMQQRHIEQIGTADIAYGMEHVSQTGLTGRWQTLQQQPRVIADTGHNVGAWRWLAPQINSIPCDNRHIVFGMVDDKDIEHVMQLLPGNTHYYWTQAATKRAVPAERVAQTARQYGLEGQCYDTVLAAYQAAMKAATAKDFIFIGGSGYVVADLLTALHP